MKSWLDRLRQERKPVEVRITQRHEQQHGEAEANYVRLIADAIHYDESAAQDRKEMLQTDPQWKKLLNDSDWQLLEKQREEVTSLKAEASRKWHGRALHFLSQSEQREVAQVHALYDQEIAKIEALMWRMQANAGLIAFNQPGDAGDVDNPPTATPTVESSNATDTGGYTPADLYDAFGVSEGTLSKYAKQAGVNRPERGKRNHLYSAGDTVAIAQKMMRTSSKKIRMRANSFIANLKQMGK